MDDDGVPQVLDFVSISLKHNDRTLIFVVKSLVKRSHQGAELSTTTKLRWPFPETQSALAAASFFNQRIKGLLQISLVACEAGQHLNIVGDDRHLIVWSKFVDQRFSCFNAVTEVRELASAVINNQNDRA